jgi:predicted RNase H-like HicB family nuclease/uncharacterized damage-inducible protein DinB
MGAVGVYDVCLELAPDGAVAHAPALPGCASRGATREEALAALPETIATHLAWLARHGEGTPAPEGPLELRVAEEQSGFAPLARGDRAALFDADRAPLSRAELRHLLRLAGHARGDLLALVQPLHRAVLDRRAGPESMTVREVLRHVGNAQEWYVSRLVDPATLPAEWDRDAAIPVKPFLRMVRRTAARRLRALTRDDLAAVVTPGHFTRHPDEPWTARKALRRMIEHELEHIAHVRGLLAT